MTTRSMIYDFLSDNGSDHATSNRKSGIVMDLLHDDRPIVYEMLEDILQSDNLVRATETDKNPTLEQDAPRKWDDERAELIAVCLRYNLPALVMRDILEAAGETL